MQTMPNKTRTAVTVGAVLLVAIVGAYWLWSGNRVKSVTPGTVPEASLTEEQPGTVSAPVSSTTTQPGATGTAGAPGATTGQSVVPTTTPVPAEYTMLPGDTLENIALKYYGDKKYYGDIEAASAISDPDHLPVGTKLTMPKLEDVVKPVTTNPAPVSATPGAN